MHSIVLKPGRERPVLRRHPWIFSGSIAEVRGDPAAGETVDIYGSDHVWLARGAYSPESQIRVRIWTWDPEIEINEVFMHDRTMHAVRVRESLRGDPGITAYREIHAESDHLPGLIVDRYGAFRVVQFLSQGVERHRDTIIESLAQDLELEGIYERSDADVRQLEGLLPQVGLLWGREPPQRLQIQEHDLQFFVDIHQGHKTGFYLDQRKNRQEIRSWIKGDVLDAFCYTGAFTLSALRAGAETLVSVDSSAHALALAVENLNLNHLESSQTEPVEADVFHYLRSCRDSRRTFDVIILDPPKFAATSSQAERASRGYKDINLLAFKLLRPGGILITFSCSGGISQELFQKIIADAALDADVDASIHAILGQAPDHPVHLRFPEGRYLKGLICRVQA
jgi:23S rRNA (cytosine1962-C5)-methyltransferase